jgi:hypothetical protein
MRPKDINPKSSPNPQPLLLKRPLDPLHLKRQPKLNKALELPMLLRADQAALPPPAPPPAHRANRLDHLNPVAQVRPPPAAHKNKRQLQAGHNPGGQPPRLIPGGQLGRRTEQGQREWRRGGAGRQGCRYCRAVCLWGGGRGCVGGWACGRPGVSGCH